MSDNRFYSKSTYLLFSFVALLSAFSHTVWAQDPYSVCSAANLCKYQSPVTAVNDPDRVDGDIINIWTDTYLINETLQVDYSLTILGNNSVFDANGIRAINVNSATGDLNLSDITIENGQPTAGFGGGAISVWGGATLTVTGGIFENNQAEFGGAIHNNGSSVDIDRSVFSGNRATAGEGGAILTDNGGGTTLYRTEIDGNEATVAGGGLAVRGDGIIDFNSSRLALVASTISNNVSVTDVVDQSNDTSTGDGTSCINGVTAIQGQTFEPAAEALTAFAFKVRLGGGPPAPGTVLNGRIRAEGQGGTVIANASMIWPSGLSEFATLFLRYKLDQPAILVPGDTYAIEIDTFGPLTFVVLYDDGDPYGSGSTYLSCGVPPPPVTRDYDFQTFTSAGAGGGIFASAAGLVYLDTSTVSGNLGDGVLVTLDSFVDSSFSTITNNSGNGFTAQSSEAVLTGFRLFSTIIAGNSGNDCDGSNFVSDGYNLIGDSSNCFFASNTGDQIGTSGTVIDPRLGPLQNNGGFTPTHAIDQTSPALDNGGTGCVESQDQRDIDRPVGLACDIGAVELTRPLQALIDGSDASAVIDVPVGIYHERIIIGDNKTLRDLSPGNVVIDASNLGYSDSVITATGGFTLEGIGVTGGSSPDNGGGIKANADDIEIDIVLRNVVFDNNDAVSSGGAIYIQNGTIDGTNVTFTNNSADEGGAIHNVGSSIVFRESEFSRNIANVGYGSAILTDNGGSTFLWETTVDNNLSQLEGGPLVVIGDSQLNLVRSTVSNNYSPVSLISGVLLLEGGDLQMHTSTVSGNSGFGIQVDPDSVVQAYFSTIANNFDGFYALSGSDVEFEDSIIAGNGPPGAPDSDCLGSFISLGYNLIGDDTGCVFTEATGDQVGNRLFPIDPLLGPLQDNGGLTLTHSIEPNSPAVNAGSSGCIEDLDQRGVDRPIGIACDIGAYEADAVPLQLGPVVLSASNLSLDEDQPSNQSYPGVVDVPIIEIPIEKLTGGTLSSPESAPLGSFPLGSFPIGSFDLQNSPIGLFPLGSFPIGSFPIGSFPLGSFPLSSIPLLSEGGWSDILVGTELEGAPPQTVTLEQVLGLDPLPGVVANIALRDLSIQGSPLASLSLRGLALGATTVVDIDLWLENAGRTDTVCDTLAASDPSFTDCDDTENTEDTLLGLEVEGAPVSALSLSSLPLGSFPIGSFPIGSFPIGSFPLGSFPIGSFPIGSFPIGSFPIGSFPIGSFPIGSFPIGSFPIGTFPIGSFPIGSFPLGSFEIDGKSFCEFYDEQAIADSAASCFDLGITNTNWLADLVAALQTAGASDIGSTPLGSFPLGSFPIGSFPIGSFPIGSFPIGSFPIGSFLINSLPIGSFPIGSFPIGSFSFGSVPLSSFEIDGKSFCEFYNEQAIADSAASCFDLGITNTNWLADLVAALQTAGASDIGSTPLGSFPMGSFPIGSFPIGSFGIADLEMSLVDIDIFEINGAPLGSFPLGSFDLIGSPLGSFPIGSFAAVIDGACAGCLTLADAARAGVISVTATLADLAGSTEFNNLTLGEVLDAMTLAMIYGSGTLANIEDTGSLTLGQLLIAMMLKTDFPWETIPLDQLDAQEFSADNRVAYVVEIPSTGTVSGDIAVAVTLSDEFMYEENSSTLVVEAPRRVYPAVSLEDPAIVENGNGTQTLTFDLVLGGFTDNTISFTVVPALALGDYSASAVVRLKIDGSQVTADNSSSTMTVIPDPMTNISVPDNAYTAPVDVLLLGFINTPDDNDYFKVAPPHAGDRVAVFMSNPAGDNDLIMYEPLSTVEAKGQTAESPALDSVPFEDDGVNYGRNLTEEPNALEDVNLATAPLASISTNRGGIDESVSAVAGDTAPFTIQVSGYNGATSDQPYTLRVKVTAEVPSPQCTARSWPVVASSTVFEPEDSWMPDTNAVFLVNWERLAASDPDGAAAADDALNAINSLIHRPGITNGVVVDVSSIYGVDYTAWDANPCDADAANEIVNAITKYLEEQRTLYPNLAYVTIVGSDEVIPFARKPDETSIANESTFAGEFSDNAMYGALITRHFLSDDTYGDIDPIAWLDRYLNVPELGVGRLVESAADIQTAAENYIAFAGVLDPQTALSAGYDFIADAAEDIDNTFNIYSPALGFSVEPALIDQPDVLPDLAWTRSDFLDATGLNTPHPVDLVSFNMHFDFDEALPSSGDAAHNYTENLITTVDLGSKDLSGGIWFTVGCHSGSNLADVSVVGGAPSDDWAQAFSRLGALYLAQNAYGLGDTEAVALTERLLAIFARNLNGSLTIGQAHAFAKQQYFADLGLYGEYDFKALQASTLFGLPMYQYGYGAVVADPLPPALPVATDPISGLASASWSLGDTGITTSLNTSKGDLFSVDGEVQFVHYRPLQPIVRRDVTSINGEIASGAFLTSLVTEDTSVDDIAFARPVIALGKIETEVETDDIIFPTTFTNISSFMAPSASGGPFAPRQQLNVIVGQFTSLADGSNTGTERLLRSFDSQVFYRPSSTSLLPTVADDFIRPEIDNVQASVVGSTGSKQAAFSLKVTDKMSPDFDGEVLRVAILYLKEVISGQGHWALVDLSQGGDNIWTGGGPVELSGLSDGEVDYMVQAVDANGNVANSTFKGLFYVAEEPDVTPAPDNGSGTIGINLYVGDQKVNDPSQWITGDPVQVEVTNQDPEKTYVYSVDSAPSVPLTSSEFYITGDGVHIVTVQESDGSHSVTFVVLIDTAPPEVIVTRPAASEFVVQTQEPASDYDCLDAGSGITTCAGPVADGESVPSTTPGKQSFVVTAHDAAGLDSEVAQNDYYVVKPLEVNGSIDPTAIGSEFAITASATNLDGFTETASINWGDGTKTPVDLSGASVNVHDIAGSHSYSTPAVYQITVTVVYENEITPFEEFTQTGVLDFVVIYDSSGGFVTGGGWFNSPPGAYTPYNADDPYVTGKAHFGFVSKYKKGQSVPDGSTNFRFDAGDLEFNATSYDWMVISGARARYKGKGTVNDGTELYKFMVTALDADVSSSDPTEDAFRIKIWLEDDGGVETVLYDNGLGADSAEGDGGTTALGGGSITVHAVKKK